MKCKCLEKIEKENGVSATINVSVTVRTKDGFTKRIPLTGIFCPLCKRHIAVAPKKTPKKSVFNEEVKQ